MHNQNQNPNQKNLRKGRYSSINQIYHITTTTLNRAPIFKDFSTARLMIQILKKSDELNNTSTLALVVMPDHIHWLFQLHQKQSLSKLIQGIKSISARAYGQPIWQAGYYDHAIRDRKSVV